MITGFGGSLGMLSAYGVNDSTITKKRVEADIEVLRDYRSKYRGMLLHCQDELARSVESYAEMPPPPELLALQPVPSLGDCVTRGLKSSLSIVLKLIWFPFPLFLLHKSPLAPVLNPVMDFVYEKADVFGIFLAWGVLIVAVTLPFTVWRSVYSRLTTIEQNGEGPRENARRTRAYMSAKDVAMQKAIEKKLAADHRLRSQIRELEALEDTVAKLETRIRREWAV